MTYVSSLVFNRSTELSLKMEVARNLAPKKSRLMAVDTVEVRGVLGIENAWLTDPDGNIVFKKKMPKYFHHLAQRKGIKCDCHDCC